MRPSTVVVVPTYNERENLPVLVRRVLALDPAIEILVVDDASPDGTGVLADELARRHERLHVLHRAGKMGLGGAYLAGFEWALSHGAGVVVEMDADGSHRPEQLPRLLAALDSPGRADLVLGSRYIPGGAVHDWPRRRELLSRAGNAYVRRALRMPLADATGGYRAFRAEALRRIDLNDVSSQGYCFQVELARRVLDAGLVVREVPIDFDERVRGASKMTGSIVREAVLRIGVWGLREHIGRHSPRRVAPPVLVGAVAHPIRPTA